MSHLLYFLSAHGFLLVPIAVILMLIVMAVGRKKYPSGSKLLGISLLVFAILNLIWGGGWNASYVHKHGVRGEAVVTNIVPTDTYINEERVVEYHCLLRTQSGKIVNVFFENSADIFYPKTDLWMPPTIGESFTVRYMAGHEMNFIIPTDDTESSYAGKLRCTKLMEEIASAKAKYEFDRKNTSGKKAYIRLLEDYISQDCDTNLTKAYMLELGQLKQ